MAVDTYGALYAFAVKVDGALFLARLVHLDFDLFAVILCVETHVDVDWGREGEEGRHCGGARLVEAYAVCTEMLRVRARRSGSSWHGTQRTWRR